jgi:repressor of nif and glnA expression
MARFFLFLLARKEVAMATLLDRSAAVLDPLKVFVKDTITSFGLVVVLKAVMVPPALRDSARRLTKPSS